MTVSKGAHFSHYEILAPHGAGGTDEVYRAGDERPGRQLAKLSVSHIARADDSCNQKCPKPAVEPSLVDGD